MTLDPTLPLKKRGYRTGKKVRGETVDLRTGSVGGPGPEDDTLELPTGKRVPVEGLGRPSTTGDDGTTRFVVKIKISQDFVSVARTSL